jgi:hypothetical protein
VRLRSGADWVSVKTQMMNAAISPAPKNINWIPMPDPICEEEVNIQLT